VGGLVVDHEWESMWNLSQPELGTYPDICLEH